MQDTDDIRWRQRFANYQRALRQLKDAASLAETRPLSQLEQQGFIKAFEFAQELAWNVMKDYFEFQGNPNITGSRDAFREAFRRGLVSDGDTWMDTIKSRNRSAHTYDEEAAKQLIGVIKDRYLSVFQTFEGRMQSLGDETRD